MIGENLKDVRKYFHDTQKQLADKLSVSESTIQSWEQEKSAPSHEMLVAICKVYGVSSDFLLGLCDDDPVFEDRLPKSLSKQDQEDLELFRGFLIYRSKKGAKK